MVDSSHAPPQFPPAPGTISPLSTRQVSPSVHTKPHLPDAGFFDSNMNGTPVPPAGGGGSRKRVRESSTASTGTAAANDRSKSESFHAAPDTKGTVGAGSDARDQPPSILVREKKQKACANCRRAKLKCIVEDNQTDCVRCRARKERCVFYPRGHDEDWQQTLTSDVYNALGHLSQMSAAVQHLVTHLTMQGIVPPLERPFHRYSVPDRDLSLLQGWSVERNRALGADRDAGRKRRKSKKADDSADDDEQLPQGPGGVPKGPMFNTGASLMGPGGGMRPADMHMQPPMFDRVNPGAPPDGISLVPLSQSAPPPQGTISSVSDIDLGGFNYGSAGEPGSHPSAPGVTPDNGIPSISPVGSAAFSVMDGGNAQVLANYHNQQGGIFGLLNGSRPAPSPNSIATAQQATIEVLGEADPRLNIVKRNYLPNSEALSLVEYFHSRLSQWLFGYRLEFGKFPYISLGPKSITPFILSVLCLVAAERVPTSHERRSILAREVTQLLVNSPADSFISTVDTPFGGGTGQKDDDGEEELDPELGIGPEEIVGACVLATFMTERDQAATIASSAFKWARGWIKWTSLTVPLPPTLGEVCGLLPIKRDATREDMARIWLLCYIVDGTEALQRDNPPPPRRDPMAYCHVLVPDSPLPGDQYSPNDILLTFHARLITLLRDWYHRRSQHEAAAAGTQAAAHARLASSVNADLAWWRADLECHSLDPDMMRHINLFWEFARMLVNATSAKSLDSNPKLKAASWAHGVEAAVGFLEKCNAWPSRNELANLPPCYLSMITLAGSVLVDAIKDQGVAECPFQAEDGVPLLNDVAEMLRNGGLPATHVARTAGQTLRSYADQLSQYL